MKALDYAAAGAAAIMNKFKPEELPPSYRFHYHQGVFLTGAERLYNITGDAKYSEYIKNWVDYNIDNDGNAPRCHFTEFDDIQPAVLLFRLYRETGDRRYKIMLVRVIDVLEKWPTNAFGGVWHKYQNKNQMWLDSMYMMGVIAAKCAVFFDNKYMFSKIHTQMRLMRDHMTDKETGLMYHMWDDSRCENFIDPDTGCVKVHWGRAMGWYLAALAEIIEILPPDETALKNDFEDTLRRYLSTVRKYQDGNTGLWYQVLDKGDDKRNWHETSCSALFVYAAAKAKNNGVIGDEYDEMIRKGYNGVIGKTRIEKGSLEVDGVCIGTGINYIEGYYSRPVVTNDLHGMGAFLLMCTEVSKSFKL